MSTRGQPQRATVLLATGDAELRVGLARVLAAGGLGVSEAAGADEALRRAAGERPQLVLLAAPLGDLTPDEVARRLGADPATGALPVLLLPGADDPEPPPPGDLVAHVRGLLRLHRAEEERRRLEEQLGQAQKMEAVGRLAGGVAHDFNNLLTVINGYAAMLLEDLADRPDSAAHARAVLMAGERAAVLTQQLLAFGRKQIVAPRLLDLNAVVRGSVALVGRLVGEDVRIALDLQPDLGGVRADPAQLEQVLLTLAVNARDAMPRGGRLTVGTRDTIAAEGGAGTAPGPHVVLEVADTGLGMTAEVRRHLFEPFFSTKGPGQGTGLGLATVYGIVKQAGGHISVETNPGAGTTFRVFLPRADEPPPHPAATLPPPSARQTVLLADDEDGVRALASQVLVTAGYVVLEARNGDEALCRAAAHPDRIDLLVSDVVMPGLGGRQLAERLLARDPHLRILYLSGHTEDEVLRQGVFSAAVHFLPKPFSPAALTEKVRQVLGATPPLASSKTH
jgi:signal transduction histidine kinase